MKITNNEITVELPAEKSIGAYEMAMFNQTLAIKSNANKIFVRKK